MNDKIFCNNCEKVGVVKIGCEKCPNCKESGKLSFYDNDEPETNEPLTAECGGCDDALCPARKVEE